MDRVARLNQQFRPAVPALRPEGRCVAHRHGRAFARHR
ncbi:MAG: hypothetical protein AVDCRST_MAG27-2002 [uncultured Craurococcus sp.]|uniref:Uncharacterized protein n=1 Tax=uncultured Craurococcus sp. TaxID=1135998 RepID=A0A6J4IGV7_9PROT|nr:MAG: hypothetical protein AVDCRST_MAG27-2002 [uncultured Craurococcus sp.]